MIVVMIIYGVILACGAKMIADGSEDLLEVCQQCVLRTHYSGLP